MIKLALNLHKFNNYAFFCPVSKLHVTVSNPVGYVNEVTTAILKALKSQTLLDVDSVVDIETGTVKGATDIKTPEAPKKEPEKAAKEETKSEKAENDNNSEQKTETTDNVDASEEKPKRGRKKADAE